MPINEDGESPVLCAVCTTAGSRWNRVSAYCVDGVDIPLCDDDYARRYAVCEYCDDIVSWGETVEVWSPSEEDDGEVYRDPPRVACGGCIESDRFGQCFRCGHWYDERRGGCCASEYRQMASSPLPHLFPHCGCIDSLSCEANSAAGRRPAAVDFDRARIQYYSYRPPLAFQGDVRPGQVFFGMEVELTAEDPDRMAAEAAALLGEHVYMKSDSSISRGFELVTHPMTYDWAMNEFPWGGWNILADRGIGSDDSTGIHIHVNKAGFSKNASHDLKWLTFWYQNRTPIELIARRRHSEFASFDNAHERKLVVGLKKTGEVACGKCDSCMRNRSERTNYYRCRVHLARYSAINLLNRETYEARVFASSIDPIHIRGALALMASTVEYTRQLSANAILRRNGYSWDAFIEWAEKSGEYQPLLDCISHIEENGD